MFTHIDPSIVKTFLYLAFATGLIVGGILGFKVRGIIEDAGDGKGFFSIFNRLKRKKTK